MGQPLWLVTMIIRVALHHMHSMGPNLAGPSPSLALVLTLNDIM